MLAPVLGEAMGEEEARKRTCIFLVAAQALERKLTAAMMNKSNANAI